MSFSGSRGWDEYARYYDWENARTIGTRDVAFWRRLVATTRGRVLELGCGSGRVLIPIAGKTSVIGIDLSAPMLTIARARARRLRPAQRPVLIRGDIRALPIVTGSLDLVIAPYGILQSLVRDVDLKRALSETARVLRAGGLFVVDLVPDLPKWASYRGQVRFRGRRGANTNVTLIESVRQDRRRGVTIFDETFVERSNARPGRRSTPAITRRFSLTFRTLSPSVTRRRLVRAGFRVEGIFGGYRSEPWTRNSETWLIVARKP